MNRVQELVAEADSIINPRLIGSDLSVLLDKLVAWVKSLDLSGIAKPALHAFLHYAIDTLIPKAIEALPTYADVILISFVLPLLKKWDEAFHVASES